MRRRPKLSKVIINTVCSTEALTLQEARQFMDNNLQLLPDELIYLVLQYVDTSTRVLVNREQWMLTKIHYFHPLSAPMLIWYFYASLDVHTDLPFRIRICTRDRTPTTSVSDRVRSSMAVDTTRAKYCRRRVFHFIDSPPLFLGMDERRAIRETQELRKLGE